MTNTYSTSEIAKIIGIHPNTVRLYEELKLIPTPNRKQSGYRIFADFHLAQIKPARTALCPAELRTHEGLWPPSLEGGAAVSGGGCVILVMHKGQPPALTGHPLRKRRGLKAFMLKAAKPLLTKDAR